MLRGYVRPIDGEVPVPVRALLLVTNAQEMEELMGDNVTVLGKKGRQKGNSEITSREGVPVYLSCDSTGCNVRLEKRKENI